MKWDMIKLREKKSQNVSIYISSIFLLLAEISVRSKDLLKQANKQQKATKATKPPNQVSVTLCTCLKLSDFIEA